MGSLIRFGVSLPIELLKNFDILIKKMGYNNRSEAIRDLIRKSLIEEEWKSKKEVAGAILLVYNHHTRELVNKLLDIQHDFGKLIISVQHVHLDHDNCMEVLAVKGKTHEIKELYYKLKSVRGVKQCELVKATTGKKVK